MLFNPPYRPFDPEIHDYLSTTQFSGLSQFLIISCMTISKNLHFLSQDHKILYFKSSVFYVIRRFDRKSIVIQKKLLFTGSFRKTETQKAKTIRPNMKN